VISDSLLQGVYLFKDMTPEERARFAKIAEPVAVASGGRIFHTGEASTAMYLIKDGSVQISAQSVGGESVDVATLASGAHFGEMSLIDHAPRSAAAEALEATHLFKFGYDHMHSLLIAELAISDKFYRALTRFLSNRLRQTTSDLTFAREKNLRHF
jgi:CRP/FNR family transcriptional regulator, cyclic AMP receptor protein